MKITKTFRLIVIALAPFFFSSSASAAVLEPGFNLIGNSLNITLNVASIFGNQDAPVAGVTSNIVTVWKWNAVDGRWAFYSPQLTSAGIASFAAGKGYEVLATINAGDGYWVNALGQMTLPAQAGVDFLYTGGSFAALSSGFNLIAQAAVVTPSQFNLDVSPTLPGTGVVPTGNFLTLWAWDAVAGTWYFYSPLLESSGGLPAVKAYADSHLFRHFQDYGKTLGVGVGFWVNATGAAPDTTLPSTPTNLTATAVSSSQINLAWTAATDNIGVTGYRVYRGGSLLTTLGNVTSYQNTGLTASTNFSYTVQAFDAAGNQSAQSTAASATTQAPPSAPDLIVTSLSYASATGIFTSTVKNQGAAATPIGLDIGVAYFVDGVYQTWGGSNISLAAGASVTIGSDGGAYTIPAGTHTVMGYVDDALRITESNENNNQLTQTITVSASDTTAPSTPTGLTATAVSSSQINLAWAAATDNIGVTGYRVYRGGSLLTTLGNVTTYQNTGLTASTNFSYTVQALDAAGNASAQSAPVSVTTPPPPAPTVSLSASPATITAGQSSTLTWSSTDADSCTASGGWSGTKANSGSQTVTPSVTITYILSCTGAGGITSASATVTVTATGAITPSLVASRVSGVAPLAVFFDATGTTAAATTRPFHDIEYRWDFGDPAGGATWGAGSRAGVSSKNSATGPVAAHVFETPGTYTVTLTAFDGTNTDTTTVSITVDNPDAVFANTNTRCFSNNTDFTGCPAGAQQVPSVTTMANVLSHAATNRRLLLHRGHVFSTNGTGWSAQGPGSIGAFGTGAKPRIRSSVTDVTIITFGGAGNPTFADWRVMDLEIDCQAQNFVDGIQPSGNARHMLFLRMAIHDCNSGYVSYYPENGAINANFPWQQIAIVDTTITNSDQYGIFVSTRNFALLGSTVDTTATEHVMRHPYIQKSVISNNTLANAAPHKHIIKLVSQSFPATGAFNEQIVISDNKFGGAGVDWTVALGPQDNTEDERVRDVVVERNWFTAGSGTQVALVVFASEITVRNNICDMTGGFDAIFVNVSRRGGEPAPNNVRIYNNTAFLSTAVSEFTVVSLDSTASNTTVRNNLGSAPLATTRMMVSGTPPGLVQSNNLMNNSPAALFVTAAPTVPADFQLKALPNPARDTGFATVPVFSDFFRSSRPQNGVIDIGAAEGP